MHEIIENVHLTPEHQKALAAMNGIARDLDVTPVVVGSLGVAVSTKTDWNPVKQNDKGVSFRDIDYLLLTSDATRNEFTSAVAHNWQGLPELDYCKTHNSQIRVKDGELHLVYGNHVDVVAAPDLFTIYQFNVDGTTIPVLHPFTYFHLLSTGTLSFGAHKLMQRARALWHNRNLPDYPKLDESTFEVFHNYHQQILQKHPLKYRIWKIRTVLSQQEHEGSNSLPVKIKRTLRDNFPQLAEFLRRRIT